MPITMWDGDALTRRGGSDHGKDERWGWGRRAIIASKLHKRPHRRRTEASTYNMKEGPNARALLELPGEVNTAYYDRRRVIAYLADIKVALY